MVLRKALLSELVWVTELVWVLGLEIEWVKAAMGVASMLRKAPALAMMMRVGQQ